jgi:hypothetical protein
LRARPADLAVRDGEAGRRLPRWFGDERGELLGRGSAHARK